MPTINSIRVHYGEEQAKLLNQLFDLPGRARQVDVSMSNEVKESLGRKELNAVKAAEAAIFVEV